MTDDMHIDLSELRDARETILRRAWNALRTWAREAFRPVPMAECSGCAERDAEIIRWQERLGEARVEGLELERRLSALRAKLEATRAREVQADLEVGMPVEEPEPRRSLYADLIASRPPRPLVPLPDEQIESVRGRPLPPVTAAKQTVKMCHRIDGRPTVTTAEIKQRAQELVEARRES